jgi:hypothetical protein
MEQSFRGERCLGHGQFAAGAINAATLLSTITGGIPAGTCLALIQCTAQAVRWRADGVAPTAAVGQPLAIGAELRLTAEFARIQFIAQAAGAILDIAFFGQAAP